MDKNDVTELPKLDEKRGKKLPGFTQVGGEIPRQKAAFLRLTPAARPSR